MFIYITAFISLEELFMIIHMSVYICMGVYIYIQIERHIYMAIKVMYYKLNEIMKIRTDVWTVDDSYNNI